MKPPKHKKNLMWNIAHCKTCNRTMKETHIRRCRDKGHLIVSTPNIPFALKDLEFVRTFNHYRASSVVQMKCDDRIYTMSLNGFEQIVPLMTRGVLDGEHWFVWSRRLSELTIEHIGKT